MYDPSELVHNTPIRSRALNTDHVKPAQRPLPPGIRTWPRIPEVVLASIVGILAGGWLF